MTWRTLNKTLALGDRLGSGGEGEVFAIPTAPGFAAKIYHDKLRDRRRAKIDAMIQANLHRSSDLVAFPVSRIEDGGGRFAGFVMPKIEAAKPIVSLFNPSMRRSAFPGVSFDFMVHVATNLARAVAATHAAGCVVGDINQSGFLVGVDGRVRVIDADSFQVMLGGAAFLCEVARPEYTPPELIGADLFRTRRTQNHDRFGLAVLIFELLFAGRHPFAGIGPDMDQLDIIRGCHYAWSERPSVLLKRPPAAPPISILSKAVAALFEEAFGPGAAFGGKERPSAHIWVETLRRYAADLAPCPANPAHRRSRAPSSACPWCRLEAATGYVFFPGATAGPAGPRPQAPAPILEHRAAQWWARLPFQEPPEALTVAIVPGGNPVEAAQALEVARRGDKPGWLRRALLGDEKLRPSQEMTSRMEQAETAFLTAWRALEARIDLAALQSRFGELAGLIDHRGDLERLWSQIALWDRGRVVAAATTARVKTFRIADARLDRIPDQVIAELSRHGIRSAADVLGRNVMAARGVGAVRAGILQGWAAAIEARCRREAEASVRGETPAALRLRDFLVTAARSFDARIEALLPDLVRDAERCARLASVGDPEVNAARSRLDAWSSAWRQMDFPIRPSVRVTPILASRSRDLWRAVRRQKAGALHDELDRALRNIDVSLSGNPGAPTLMR